MNPNNSSSIRCPYCNLVNFANAEFCKRCKNSLTQVNFSGDTNSININITLPRAVPQQNPYNNYNQPPYNQPPYNQPQLNQPPYNQPQFNQNPYNQPQFNPPAYNQPANP